MAIALQLEDDEELALSSDGAWTIRYDAAAKRIKLRCDGVDVWSVDAKGEVRLLGVNAGRQKTV